MSNKSSTSILGIPNEVDLHLQIVFNPTLGHTIIFQEKDTLPLVCYTFAELKEKIMPILEDFIKRAGSETR